MIAKINTCSLYGIHARSVTVEVNITNRGVGYQVTGQPDDNILESLNRIEMALASIQCKMPRTKVSINLSPAGIRKSGTSYDLPVATGILVASGQLIDIGKLKDFVMTGELGLDGTIHPVRGALCMAMYAKNQGYKGILLPQSNAEEAALVEGIEVYALNNLHDLLNFISTDCVMQPYKTKMDFNTPACSKLPNDFSDVKGQENVKRALEIAAAGGHNALLIGPPGIGKTMLAKRLPSILPPLSVNEAMETTRIYSVAKTNTVLKCLVTQRPFRNPHHTASDAALAGGGIFPVPGEITLAHNGVLFLDELPEFKRSAIEILRQPMEERKITIARSGSVLEFPASFMLIASMNPCVCGYFNHPTRPCTCSLRSVYAYRKKISGPLLERIDLHIEVDSLSVTELMQQQTGESSASVRQRVIRARTIQSVRYKQEEHIYCNAQLPDAGIEKYCSTEQDAINFLLKTMDRLQLSVRSYTRILKIARTIADLAGKKNIELAHMAEAIHYRGLDKPIIKKTQPVTKSFIKTNLHEIRYL